MLFCAQENLFATRIQTGVSQNHKSVDFLWSQKNLKKFKNKNKNENEKMKSRGIWYG